MSSEADRVDGLDEALPMLWLIEVGAGGVMAHNPGAASSALPRRQVRRHGTRQSLDQQGGSKHPVGGIAFMIEVRCFAMVSQIAGRRLPLADPR